MQIKKNKTLLDEVYDRLDRSEKEKARFVYMIMNLQPSIALSNNSIIGEAFHEFTDYVVNKTESIHKEDTIYKKIIRYLQLSFTNKNYDKFIISEDYDYIKKLLIALNTNFYKRQTLTYVKLMKFREEISLRTLDIHAYVNSKAVEDCMETDYEDILDSIPTK